MYNVMIVEDQAMPRQLFEAFISMSDNYRLVHSIKNADMADIYCERSGIDLILMDVCTELNSNGLDAAERLKQKHPHIKIIIVTSMPEVSYLERARKIGVDSFWYKEVSEEPILSLMDRTMAGENIYPDSTPVLDFGFIKTSDLSEREIAVLREVICGDTNAEIAEKLNMSQYTVRDYVQVLMEKTGFHTRTELAVKARELGIIIPENKK